jgi:hypothetical protein
MKRAATSTIAVVLVIVVVVVGVIAVVGLATNGASAVEVGDQTVSRESVNDELRAVAENQELVDQAGADRVTRTRGSVVSQLAAGYVLTGAVQEALIEEYLDRKGERITAADRAGGDAQFTQTVLGQFSTGFPRWYRERGKQRLAAYVALARVAGIDLSSQTAADDVATELRPIARKVGVRVDPRYGRYVAKEAAVAPYSLTAGLLDSGSSDNSN